MRSSDHQRRVLTTLVRTGTRPAAQVRRARILLEADADGPDAWCDSRIGKTPDRSFMTVRRVRRQFVAENLDATPHRRRPTGRRCRKLDGEQEARLAAVACSPTAWSS